MTGHATGTITTLAGTPICVRVVGHAFIYLYAQVILRGIVCIVPDSGEATGFSCVCMYVRYGLSSRWATEHATRTSSTTVAGTHVDTIYEAIGVAVTVV